MSLLKSKWIPTKIQTILKNYANLKSKKSKEKDRKEFKNSGKVRLLRKWRCLEAEVATSIKMKGLKEMNLFLLKFLLKA